MMHCLAQKKPIAFVGATRLFAHRAKQRFAPTRHWERTLQCAFTGSAHFSVHLLPTKVGAPSGAPPVRWERTL